MMADHSSSRRRRSPGSSVGGRRKDRDRDSRRAPSEIVYEEPQRMRVEPSPSTNMPMPMPIDRGVNNIAYGGHNTYLSSSNSSSSSFELVDISRSFPPKRRGLATFFTAPSERRKLRRRRSSRLFKLNNSSSSSVNSDLAYGNGYIKRPKLRRVRSRSGKTMDRESARWSDRERERHRNNDGGRYSGSERRGYASGSDRRGNVSGSERRGNTEAEILAVGAGLAKLARDQNKHDLRNHELRTRSGRSPQVVAVKENSHHYGAAAMGVAGAGALYGASRGLGNSKISHGSDTYDEDGWESASDAESENSVDSRLAFGAEAAGGWWGKEKHRPLSRKNTVVDPRLFGPENSLNGFVDRPVGFEEVTWSSSSDFGQQYRTYSESVGPNESFSGSQASLKHVFPVQSSGDPTRFEAARNSVASGSEPYISSRPGPAPLQPQPYTPVSQSLYNEPFSNISESPSILKRSSSSGKSNSVAQAALAGVAGVAVGAAIASSRSDERKDKDKRKEIDRDDASRVSSKRRDDDRDDVSRVSSRRRDEERDDSSRVSLKRRDSDRKEGKDERRRDKRDSPDRDDRKDKKREKERKKEGSRYSDEERREKKRDKRREDAREETRDERREKRREERNDRRSEVATRPEIHYDDRRAKSEAAVSTVSAIDPMMFQVADDAFPTPTTSPQGHRRHESVPKVVTVEREPEFGRNRSSSIKDAPFSHRGDYFNDAEYDERGQRYQGGVSDHGLYHAEAAYKDTSHSTAPIVAGAIGVAAAVVAGEAYRESRSEKRRSERRQPSEYGQPSEYDDYSISKPRGREPERDPVQEEADRAYREIVMARKIASQVIRSRSASPDGSVVGRYARKEEEEEVQIVTPPEMDHPKHKGPYDAPNADFQPDYQFDDPRQFRPFQDRSSSAYLKRDPDAVKPRPLLNLVRPTPVPSPLPEKQKQFAKPETSREEPSRSEPSRPEPTRSESGRSETARSEPPRSSKSRDRNERPRTAVSEIASGPRGNGYSSPTASTVSKGVTWGENETKHFDVESPSDHHRDEYISSSDVPLFEKSPEPKQRSEPKSDSKPSKGWGAIAAGIIGAGVGVAATSSDTSTSKKSKSKDTEREKSPPNAYEYRGVIVEPESPPAKGRRQASPPSPGPKPTPQQPHMPGGFDDDLDFTAHVAAGLKDTGFDPNIVIDDPSFRRRDSPPGSNARGVYQAPFAETVTDLGQIPATESGISGSGFVMGEVPATPQDWRSISPEGDEVPVKLSKKEQKKRDKAKRQSSDSTAFEETPLEEVAPAPKEQDQGFYFNEPKLSKKEQKKRDKEAKRQSTLAEDVTPISEPFETRQIVDEPESYVETPKKSKKKSKRDSAVFDDDVDVASPSGSSIGRKTSVPVDEFDDLRNENDWDEPKKSKKKSKRDSERFDSPPRSAATSEISERSSSRKKDKSRSQTDDYEQDPATVSLPPSTPSEASQDRDYDDSRRSRKSPSRDSGVFDHRDRSVVSEAASRYDDEPRRKKKSSSRSSTRDKDDFDDSRSVVSVASAPAGDEEMRRSKKKEKEKKGGGFFGLFGSKSEVGARDESPKGSKDDFDDVKSKKKKKRSSMPDASSLYGDKGSQSVGDLSRSVSNGRSSHRYDDDEGARSDGERKKSRSRGDSSASKKDSFLGNAGTLGAGVGLAGAAVAIAAHQHQQSKADEASGGSERTGRQLVRDDEFDPEITQRHFRPSIDPQYGDLLPLPPSEPATPASEEFGEFPSLPESRPHTPEEERLAKDRLKSSTRKHLQETPVKSPSQSAVPINFKMRKGNRSTPSSPGLPRATPLQTSPGKTSPGTPTSESLPFSRNSRNRPTSWDSAKEYRPLYLPESIRRGSTVNIEEEEQQPLPELPASVTSSRSSSHLEFEDAFEHSERSLPDFSNRFNEPLSVNTELASEENSGGLLDSQQSTPKAKISFRDDEKPSDREIVVGAIAGAALVGTAAYLASSSHELKHDTPPPIDPMSKDRSSYLLQSSPISREDDSSVDYNTDSPSRGKSHLSKDSLGSIQEESREQALKSLTGEIPVEDQPEEFSFSKSKKDKKKDKKKGKLSRSSTQDDLSLSEPVVDAIPEASAEAAAEPKLEFLPSSKKDKKMGKKGKSATWEMDDAEPLPSNIDESVADASKEITELLPEAAPFDDFSTPTKKGKKDKKGKSKTSWDPEPAPQANNFELASETPINEVAIGNSTSRGLVEDVPDEIDAFSISSKKKGKKDKKAKSKTVWDPEPLEELAPESAREATDDVQPALTAVDEDEFATPKSKKDKKIKKGKDSGSWDVDLKQPESSDLPPPPLTIDEAENFSMPLSKKDKKKDKKGKGSNTPIEQPQLETEPIHNIPVLPTQEYVATAGEQVTDDPFASKSKKDKKKDKNKSKSTGWEPELEPQSEPEIEEVFHDIQDTDTADEFHDFPEENLQSPSEQPEATALELENVVPTGKPSLEPEQPKTEEFSEFSTLGSKKGKKSKKSRSWDVQQEAQPPTSEIEPSVEKSQTDVAETHDVVEDLATPISRKGKKKKGKAQNWETEESPADFFTTPTSMIPRDDSSQSKDYFSGAIIPAAAVVAGAALLGAHHEKESNIEPESKPSVPDPKVEEQLNLAKQLREEFASGSKKSKKDKKKRQSLPATPDPEEFRSRAVEEPSDVPIRARSLSIAAADRDKAKLTFSEEQLELARQMKEDFAKGSKKSKKGKNKRQDTGTWDDDLADQSVEGSSSRPDDFNPTQEVVDTTKANVLPTGYEESQLELARQMKADFEKGSKKSKKDKKKRQDTSGWDEEPTVESPSLEVQGPEDTAASDITEDTSKRDVTPIVYPEDQISLARQLQADFNKKSKKDKKRHSTSQTPQSEEPAEDYFGSHSQSTPFEEPQSYDATAPLELQSEPKNLSNEGPASRYNAEQLELARQMKEDFAAAASKKNKKDKKGKKRNTTDDDFLSQEPIVELADPLIADASNLQPEATETSLTADPEDEFAFTSKKSKKDKKGKKRDTPETPMEVKEPVGVDVPAVEPGMVDAPAAVDAEDDFSFSSKKSKNDKKGKKRDSIIPVATDVLPSDATFQEPTTDVSGSREIDTVATPAEPEDDFSFSSKKSKKDKKGKKRDSLAQSTPDDQPSMESQEPLDANVLQTQLQEEAAVEPEEEFASFSSKKSKKDKKGKKRESSIDVIENSAPPSPVIDDSETVRSDVVQEPTDAIPAPKDDDFSEFNSKKSKDNKGKKNRDRDDERPAEASISDVENIITQSDESQIPTEPVDDFEFSSKKSKKDKKGKKPDSFPAIIDEPKEPFGSKADDAPQNSFSTVVEPDDDFAFTSKKSKKDKKKQKGSVVQEEITPEVIPQGETQPSSSTTNEPVASIESSNDASDDFGFSSKKSKKDKKKRGSLLRHSSVPSDFPDEPVETQDVQLDTLEDSTATPPPVVEDEFAFSSKKSKKDKKKGKAMQDFSPSEEPIQDLQQVVFDEASKDLPESSITTEDSTTVESVIHDPASDETKAFDSTDLPTEAIEDAFDDFAPTKKSKKEKKKGKGSKDSSKDVSESSTPLDEPAKESVTVGVETQKKSVLDEPQASTSLDADGTGVWDAFTSTKKSKDKKKGKNLLIESGETSGLSTPTDTIEESSKDIVEPVTISEDVHDKETMILETTRDSEVPTEEHITQEPEADEWSSLSAKSSKKDKKKRKSGVSTPIEGPIFVEESVDLGEANSTIPAQIEERRQDEWSAKPSKKDKKKNKGKSTGIEALPEPIEAAKSVDEPEPPIIEEPVQDEWSSFSAKPSKKDKKKKSGFSTPIEIAPEESTQLKSSDAIPPTVEESSKSQDLHPPITEETAQEQVDEWATPSKKSKKDKKNRKSSTPFDDMSEPAPASTIIPDDAPSSLTIASKDLVEEPLQVEETVQDEADEWGSFNTKKSKMDKKKSISGLSTPVEAMPDSAKGFEFPTNVSMAAIDEDTPVDDEWGSLPSKKGKKGKKGKSGLSTPIEDTSQNPASIDEPEAKLEDSHLKEDPLLVSGNLDEPTTTLPEEATQDDDDFGSFSSKKSKKDKKKNRKSGLSTPAEETPSPPVQESFEPGEIVEESSKIDETQTPVVEEITRDNIDSEWGSLPSKKSKKDKKNRKSGVSTPVEEVPEHSNVLSQEDIAIADSKEVYAPSEPAPEPIDDSKGSFSTSKKSKKDKKKNKWGTSTPFEAEAVIEPEVVESSTQEVVEEPADEWAPTSSKKSKKDKKSKSGTSTQFEAEPIVEPSQSEEKAPEISEMAEPSTRDAIEEPVDEWAATPKKSKKDKKKGKSGSSTPFEVEPDEQFPSTPKIEESRKIVEEPVEEWAPTSSKKSKKDKKKGKSGTSTPFEQEPEEQLPSTPKIEESQEIEELADEWAPISSKKSKKDKKKSKSGFSTPIDDSFASQEPEITQEKLSSTINEKDSNKPLEIGLATTAIVAGLMHQDTPSTNSPQEETEEPTDEWGSYSTKKSKKDKNKRKSEISKPTEEPQEKGMPIEEPVKTEITSEPIPTEDSPAKFAIQDVTENIAKQDTFESTATENPPLEESPQEPEDEWGSVLVKKYKKDKKGKGKKGTNDESPIIEQQTSTPPANDDDVPASRDLVEPVNVSEPPQEPEDNFASFSTKKGKDKKGKGKSNVVFDEPALFESSMTTPPQEDIVKEARISEFSSSQDTPQEFEEEWGSTKKSKKDNGKGQDKETFEPEAPIVSEQRSVTLPTEIIDAPALVEETSKESEDVKEPEAEWGSFSQKKGKKDKKGKDKSKDNFDIPTPETPVESEQRPVTPLIEPPTEPTIGGASKDIVGTKEPEEEWGSFSTKKSKKDKKGKGKSKDNFDTPDPFVEPVAEPSSIEETPMDSADTKEPEKELFSLKKSKKDKKGKSKSKDNFDTVEPVIEPASIEETPKDNADTKEPEEEFFSLKKSKKDKKGKGKSKDAFDTPEPAIEPQQRPVTPTVEAVTEPVPSEGVPKDLPEEEFGSFSLKKSKKDKKRQKSGVSTPIEEPIVLDEPKLQEQGLDTIGKSQPLSEPAEIEPVVETTHNVPEEDFAFTAKKSKKDKKRQKSGLSTPVEPLVVEKTKSRDVESSIIDKSQPLYSEPAEIEPVVDASQEPVDEFAFTSKKSKKDKKKQKSGLSTPAEPTILDEPVFQDVEPSAIDKSQLLFAEPAEILETRQEVADDEFASTSKKPKKDKKKQKSGVSTPAEPTILNEPDLESSTPFATPVVESIQEAPDDNFAFSSKTSKKDKKDKKASRTDSITEAKEISPSATPALSAIEPSTLYPIVSENVQDEKSREIPDTIQPKEIEEDGSSFGSISRKDSKKDKRKRQAYTVDTVVAEDSGSAKSPITSWADDVEEAEVERELPVIEDIAVDESLSHIAKTTEATPVDDFVRPNKKGKKGKKGKSVDMSRLPVSFDPTKKDLSKEESNVSIVAAAGAAVAGATLVGGMSGKKKPVEPVKEPETPTTPVRKLTKKEKRKQSIDKRAPSNDIFDDDALWEGADPKDFEEKDTKEADDGDDGFWSPSQQDEPILTAETTFQEPALSRDQTMLSEDGQASRALMAPMDRPLSPPDDMDFARTLAQQSTPRTPDPVSRDISSQRSAAIDSLSVDKDTLFHESPIERSPLRSSQFRRSGFSDLPAVEEESPVDFDSEHYSAPRIVDSDNANRDSAFVTDSPTPNQGAFSDNHEHVRDSGVHMRDYSPAAASRASASNSDAAISRLSCPAVDEETETIDLKSQRQRSATPVKDKRDDKSHRSHEFYVPQGEKHDNDKKREEKSHRGHEFYVQKEDTVKNLFSSERSEGKQSKHHEEKPRSSLDLLPSQRARDDIHTDLHRTSTIHKHENETSSKYHDDRHSSIDLLPSQIAKEDTPSELDRTSTIHKHGHDTAELHHDEKRPRVNLLPSKRAKEDAPSRSIELTPTPSSRHGDKQVSRDVTPTKSDKADKSYISMDSEKTSSTRKPAEESIVQKRLKRFETPELPSPSRAKEDRPIVKQQRSQTPEVHTASKLKKEESYSELKHLGRPKAEQTQGISDNTIATGVAIAGAAGLGFAAGRQLSQEKRSSSAASQRSLTNVNRLRNPNRPDSVNSNRSGTPPLRRSDRKVSGDLRSLSQRSQVDLAKEAELAALTSTSTADATSTATSANPTANEGRVRAKEMADVYDGFGEGRMGSPRSPTRPHSMRRRQSMQVLDLESKVEQLAAENRMLAEAKAQAERTLQSSTSASSSLVEKDAEIDSLKRTLEWLTNEVSRLTEVNSGLTSANVTIENRQNERYNQLESQHARTTRELQETRDAHTGLTEGMEAIVIAQVKAASQEKDQEIARLRAELEGTKKKIREMQAKILMSKTNDVDFLTVRDEDYFESTCEKLCLHVQQWVLRFSKFSDMRACRLTTEINNDKTIDRLDNAILDGSDVDSYLTDRVKRRDVFMSMTMTMVWEFIFTRYLFGMDREQRQKLKSLEKLLSEVGPATAVHQWRATTLTLLSKRESFVQQREQDTQAVVHAILETLSEILPPPSHLENQIEEQLRRVVKSAVDLSIEMRTQRAEYMMLPPLQPEYDANGDLASKVSFNAALMNERSGDTTSNETLEQQKAVVRIVLFPLVVKKGDDRGEGDEEIVVCPAQVLVAKSKRVRMMSPGRNLSKTSMQSSMPADYNDRDDEEL